MDIYTKYNRQEISDRQIDTLIGLSMGLAADGKIDQTEAELLHNWLGQCAAVVQTPIVVNIFNRVSEMLSDGVLDGEEAGELLELLRGLTGEDTEMGEVPKTASLPLCAPAPIVHFPEKAFLFTGTFAFGKRKVCQAAILERGGVCIPRVTKSLHYLVIGSYVTDSWSHQTFGRKIEKAMEYRDQGVPLSIVSEAHWLESAGL